MELSQSRRFTRLTCLFVAYLLALTVVLTLRLLDVMAVGDLRCRRLVVDDKGIVAKQQGVGAGNISYSRGYGDGNKGGGGGDGFRDEYFSPVLAAYHREAQKTRAATHLPRFRNGSVPKVVMYINKRLLAFGWLPWYVNHMKDIHDGRCALPCVVTINLNQVQTADAVLIHLRSVESPSSLASELGPRDPSQPWIMFEPETHLLGNVVFYNNYRSLNGVFNRTMHYRRDSDVRMLHGFVVRRGREASVLPPVWRRPPHVQQDPSVDRKLAVAFISNCNDASGRLDYVTKLRRHAPVDVYGRCGDLKCGGSLYTLEDYRADQEPCLQFAGLTYLFYLAFENALCADYVTEKLYNLLYYPIVPVVLGAAEYPLLMPPHSYINARDYSPAQLAQKLLHLAHHPKEYQEYLSWRQYYLPSTIGGNRLLCDLCVRLHDDDFYQHHVVEDFYDWYVTKGKCNIIGKRKF
ncbi:3-galactosyl-N-acetylglucosaminide 4-alpha-L-fucosyltransferase FUT3-like isoform X2 [Eriocheir sinensis]|nr:3-galactosyl-N-acetylglucosaminide 4-alpha-L-fucosyltransferase FUT3-like isoform X2 [Eriocheir sinensis]